jgi:hypothetical protein
MSWDDVHRLELQLRARSAAISSRTDPGRCPACGRETEGGIQLGGVTIHEACLPALRASSN